MKIKAATLVGAVFALTFSASAMAANLVSVGGAISETIYALGAEDQLVARDTTTTYPEAAKALPDVGYIRQLSAEGVMSVTPERMITNQDAGPAEALAQLTSLGVEITTVQMDYSAAGVAQMIREVGGVVGKSKEAEAMAKALTDELAAIMANNVDRRVMFVMDSSRGMNVSGAGTRAHALITMAGGTNVFADVQRYKPISAESVTIADPEVVIVMLMGRPKAEGFYSEHVALKSTQAAANGKIYTISPDLLAFGPRLPAAVEQVQKWLK